MTRFRPAEAVVGAARPTIATTVLAALLAACASEGSPPGGPEDHAPPVLVASDPAERAVNAESEQGIRLTFDEAIDPRLLSRLPQLILVNPDSPEFDYELDEERVILSPTKPMIDGVTYMVTILPGLADRNGNATTRARTILFSVGGEEPIPLSLVRATIVRDTVPAAGARYLLQNTETEFAYRFVADSSGRLEVEGVEFGPYVATAWLEQVPPDGWQVTDEPGDRDTFALGAGNRAHEATYRIAVVDTTPPVVVVAAAVNSRLLRVRTDDRLAGTEAPASSSIRVWAGPELEDYPDVRPDSIPLERARGRPIAVSAVERAGPSELQVALAESMEKDRLYRVELVGVENVDGLAAEPGTGVTFVPEYEGPAIRPAEPVELPPGGS
ncbi:MAG: Ig-like domain-containing protein [Gemmatimonadetes bacterium]|nr:Ig-like domain-containing protein [Gemmatimonadota bacterium]